MVVIAEGDLVLENDHFDSSKTQKRAMVSPIDSKIHPEDRTPRRTHRRTLFLVSCTRDTSPTHTRRLCGLFVPCLSQKSHHLTHVSWNLALNFLHIFLYTCSSTDTKSDVHSTSAEFFNESKSLCNSARRSPLWPPI